MKTLTAFGKCSNKFCGTSPSSKTFLKYFRPAVNRQPMFPREMTRRADTACPPKNSLSEFLRLLQRTRSKIKRKYTFSMKIIIFGATMKTLCTFGKNLNKFCGTSPSGKTFLKYLILDYSYSQENS